MNASGRRSAALPAPSGSAQANTAVAWAWASTHKDDATIEDLISPAKLANWDQINRATSAQVREGVELIDAFKQINAAPPMPKVPAIVLTADKPYRTDLLPPEATEGDKLVSFADWLASQERLASALGAKHITQTKSGHHIYLYSPALVIDAIRQVVDDIRAHTAPTAKIDDRIG